MVERPSRLTPGPSDADRRSLTGLITLASYGAPKEQAPKLLEPPVPAARPVTASLGANPLQAALGALRGRASEQAATAPEKRLAALHPTPAAGAPATMTDAGWSNGWVQAPAFDEEHPEELSYRPFPIAPLMTATASPDDPALARLKHPDVARVLETIDDGGAIQPMALRPGKQIAQLMWAQQFQGQTVSFDTLASSDGPPSPSSRLADRKVKTSGGN